MNRLLTFILALSSQVIAIQAENPKDVTFRSPTHDPNHMSVTDFNARLATLLSGTPTSAPSSDPLVDLYRLWLDGSGRKERLTFFTDFRGWKAAEGVVSDDGRFMLFQDGRAGMEAGQGFSIYLYDFRKAVQAR